MVNMKKIKLTLTNGFTIETTIDEMSLMSQDELMKLTKGERIIKYRFFEESDL